MLQAKSVLADIRHNDFLDSSGEYSNSQLTKGVSSNKIPIHVHHIAKIQFTVS